MTDGIASAREALAAATALIVSAGAGMGVDSGLPDFRGPEGFWRAYPPYRALGLAFEDLANPRWFEEDPEFAWGFYGHRLELYRKTRPHEGFARLLRRGQAARDGYAVVTSNVDGQFQRAGFDPDRVVEVHGAIDWMQCTACEREIFPADGFAVDVDPETFRARRPLPTCDQCSAILRPNILMFGDGRWNSTRSGKQERWLGSWLQGLPKDARVVVVECGAGLAIPTIRSFGERLQSAGRATLVRINKRESEVPEGAIGLAMGAKEALEKLET